MFTHLFIDSLNALLSELEANSFHIFTNHHAKLSLKIESFTMELLSFKGEVYSNISKLIKAWTKQKNSQIELQGKQTIDKLNAEIQSNKQKLYRYRLHNILKRKAAKKQRESMLASHSFCQPQKELYQLQKSIILIEKDLGIQNESDQNQKLGITRIINKSLSIGLQSTPISKILPNQSVISYEASSERDLASKSMQFYLPQEKPKQNQQANQKHIQHQEKITILPKKSIGKKKKVIVSKSDTREGLLENVLQETYNQCLDKK